MDELKLLDEKTRYQEEKLLIILKDINRRLNKIENDSKEQEERINRILLQI
jgi:hypothetical protein